MKKQIICLLVVLSLIAVPLWAGSPDGGTRQAAHFFPASKIIKLQISGSAIPLANPLTGPFPIMANMEGSGNIGHMSGQGMFLYDQLIFDNNGKTNLQFLEGQESFRLQINGEVLLGVFDPGETGWLQIIDPATGSAVWEQNWTGRIVGGTGRFAGMQGTFKKSASGFAVLFSGPGQPASAVVQPYSGTMEIRLDE